jgi:hypothetical protein
MMGDASFLARRQTTTSAHSSLADEVRPDAGENYQSGLPDVRRQSVERKQPPAIYDLDLTAPQNIARLDDPTAYVRRELGPSAQSAELTALLARAELQIADHRLEQPAGDNALESYDQLKSQWPDDAAATAIGQRLSAAFWVLADDAIAAEDWEKAAHYFGILDALPPVPAAAILAGARREVPSEKADAPGSDSASGAVRSEPGASASAPAMSHDIAKASEPKTAAIVPSTIGTSQDPVAFAIARGDEAMARGDIISARRFYELAAAKGLAGAATAMGRTFDPAVLQGLGVRGLRADVEAARQWYRKAADDGDKEAIVRLQQLPRTANMPTEKE